MQALKGLLGELNMEKTGGGVIVCRDGFSAATFSREALEELGRFSGHAFTVEEVDRSSLFLTIEK